MRSYERWRDGTWHDGLVMDRMAGELNDAVPPRVDEAAAGHGRVTLETWDVEGPRA
jgi:hypothetical protein